MSWPWQLPSNLTFLCRVGHTVGPPLQELVPFPHAYTLNSCCASRTAVGCDEC